MKEMVVRADGEDGLDAPELLAREVIDGALFAVAIIGVTYFVVEAIS